MDESDSTVKGGSGVSCTFLGIVASQVQSSPLTVKYFSAMGISFVESRIWESDTDIVLLGNITHTSSDLS